MRGGECSMCQPRSEFVVCSITLWALQALGQVGDSPQFTAAYPTHHDVSAPLRDMPPVPPETATWQVPPRVAPLLSNQAAPTAADPALQSSTGPSVATISGLNFD